MNLKILPEFESKCTKPESLSSSFLHHFSNLLEPMKSIILLFLAIFQSLGPLQARANLPSTPNLPINHCYHWVNETSRKVLTYKYNHAEKTGGEFSFYTDQRGGANAGKGIYCAKTAIESTDFGERVIRLNLIADIVFMDPRGQKICPLEPNQAECNKRPEDIYLYDPNRNWYVIRTPESIESWTANDDDLIKDLTDIQPYGPNFVQQLQMAIELMRLEVQSRPKITYLNPNARMPFLKLIKTEESLAKAASKSLMERILKLPESDFSSAAKELAIEKIIGTLGTKKQYEEFPAIHQILRNNSNSQSFLVNYLKENLKSEDISKMTPGALVGIDALVPESIALADFQTVFEASFKSSDDVDSLLKFALNSTKAKAILSQVNFDNNTLAKIKSKESLIVVLKLLIPRIDREVERTQVAGLISSLAKILNPEEFTDSLTENGLLTEAQASSTLITITDKDASVFSVISERHLIAVLDRLNQTLPKKNFDTLLTKLFDRASDWSSLAVSLTQDLVNTKMQFANEISAYFPPVNKVFNDTKLSPKLLKNYNLIALRMAFKNPKMSAGDWNYYRRFFAILMKGKICDGFAFDELKFETAKIQNYPFEVLNRETFVELTSKKNADLLSSNCNPVSYAEFLALNENRLPAGIATKLIAHFDSLKFENPKEFDRNLKLDAKILVKNPNIEWKLIEKIALHNLNMCKTASCEFSLLTQKLFRSYFYSRFDVAIDNKKNHSTSNLISRLTYLLYQKGFPSLAWVTLTQESLFYNSESSNDWPMLAYLKIYSAPKISNDVKKKIDLLLPFAMDSNFLEILIDNSAPSEEKEEVETLRVQKSAHQLLQKMTSNVMADKFLYFKNSPGFSISLAARIDERGSRRSSNFYCDFLGNFKYRARIIADRLKISADEIQKSVNEIAARDCK